eukprot:13948940-Alexandrium_andersonii.AAC.1
MRRSTRGPPWIRYNWAAVSSPLSARRNHKAAWHGNLAALAALVIAAPAAPLPRPGCLGRPLPSLCRS